VVPPTWGTNLCEPKEIEARTSVSVGKEAGHALCVTCDQERKRKKKGGGLVVQPRHTKKRN
jgi:hypothetical protein